MTPTCNVEIRAVPDTLTRLSDLIVSNPQLVSFADLLEAVGRHGKVGATMLEVDIKPDFPDTPKNWESQIETAFTWWGR